MKSQLEILIDRQVEEKEKDAFMQDLKTKNKITTLTC